MFWTGVCKRHIRVPLNKPLFFCKKTCLTILSHWGLNMVLPNSVPEQVIACGILAGKPKKNQRVLLGFIFLLVFLVGCFLFICFYLIEFICLFSLWRCRGEGVCQLTHGWAHYFQAEPSWGFSHIPTMINGICWVKSTFKCKSSPSCGSL